MSITVAGNLTRDLEHRVTDDDLAVASGFFNGRPLPARGRSVDGWPRGALEAMAGHFEKLGWRVQPDRPSVPNTVDRGGICSESTEIVGALRARRYGWEAPILVRVDDCGEIYARLVEPGDVLNAKLRMVEGPEAPRVHDLDLDDRWAPPGRDVSTVIAALAVEQTNQLGMAAGLGLE